jgi:hypothetical protein
MIAYNPKVYLSNGATTEYPQNQLPERTQTGGEGLDWNPGCFPFAGQKVACEPRQPCQSHTPNLIQISVVYVTAPIVGRGWFKIPMSRPNTTV